MPRTCIEIKVPYADLLLRHAPFQPIPNYTLEVHDKSQVRWIMDHLEHDLELDWLTASRWYKYLVVHMPSEIHATLEYIRDDTRGVLPSRELTQLLTGVNIFEVEKVPILLSETVLFNEQTFTVTVENDYLHMLMFERPEASAEF